MVEGGLNALPSMDGRTTGRPLIGKTSSLVGSRSDKKKGEIKMTKWEYLYLMMLKRRPQHYIHQAIKRN